MPAPKGHEPYPGCETGGTPKIYTKEFIENEADELEKWMNKKEGNIFIKDFCFERHLRFQRISEWVKENEKFSDIYERLQMKQETAMFKGGLSKKFSYPMCAMILSHFHGIVAKTEQKIIDNRSDSLDFALNTINNTSKDLVNEHE